MNDQKITRRIEVYGRVQGVWFRASTKEEADKLGVTGTVRNRQDGSVEIVATGSPADLDQLEAWCRKGPPLAKVSNVNSDKMEYSQFGGFNVLR